MILKTHNCPDRTQYDDETQWPTDSYQGHWSAVGASGMEGTDKLGFNPAGTILAPAHIHIDLTFPRYAELSSPITIPFVVKAFHFVGQIIGYGGTIFKPGPNDPPAVMFWDETKSSTPPVMIGDPMGLKQWTGHFTVGQRVNYTGWDVYEFAVDARFDNKDIMTVQAVVPYWNAANPSIPDSGARLIHEGIASPNVFGNGSVFGANEIQIDDFLPTAPFDGKWHTTTENPGYRDWSGSPTLFSNSYGGQALLHTTGSQQQRLDLDFHNNIPGSIVAEVDMAGIIPQSPIPAPLILDLTHATLGPHKFAMIRFQPEDNIPTNSVATLLVLTVTKPGIPPPPTTTTVPNVIGLLQADAVKALTDAKLVAGAISNLTDVSPVGTVLTQSVIPELVVLTGTAVSLTVSSGIVETDGPIIGTIHARPDGTTCICGNLNATTEMRPEGPCIILRP